MRLAYPSYEILYHSLISLIEAAGRTCYKSETNITEESAIPFVRARIKQKHFAMLEHSLLTVKFVVNRGVTHELVRHRLAAYAQESTRWCNYKGGVTFIIPPRLRPFIAEGDYTNLMCLEHINDPVARRWMANRYDNEQDYLFMLNKAGWPPEEARGELPITLKTEIVVSANFRQWRLMLSTRALGEFGRPHPHMVEVMLPLLQQLRNDPELSSVFCDLE